MKLFVTTAIPLLWIVFYMYISSQKYKYCCYVFINPAYAYTHIQIPGHLPESRGLDFYVHVAELHTQLTVVLLLILLYSQSCLFAVGILRPSLGLNRHVLHVRELWLKIIFLFIVVNWDLYFQHSFCSLWHIKCVGFSKKNYALKLYLLCFCITKLFRLIL